MWDHIENEAVLDEHDADIVEEGTDAGDDFAETDLLEADAMSDDELAEC